MSSSSSVSAAEEIIADHAFFFIEYCALFAEATLIFHEYMITFENEVRVIWHRKITGAAVLFFLNRYIMILTQLIIIPTWGPMSDLINSCKALGWMDVVLNLLPYFIWNAFSTLRTYALCGRDWRIPALVCLLMMGPIAANVYPIPFEFPVNTPPPTDCTFNNMVTLVTHNKLVLTSRLCLICADAIVTAVTWWKTYRLKKAAEAAQIKTSIVDLLLRDGSIYFLTMLCLNVLHIIINFVEQVSFLGDMADTLSSILVSRFIINLRDIDSQDRSPYDTTTTDSPGAVSEGGSPVDAARGTLVFASRHDFVDSMGASLEFPSDDRDDGQTEDGSELTGVKEESPSAQV